MEKFSSIFKRQNFYKQSKIIRKLKTKYSYFLTKIRMDHTEHKCKKDKTYKSKKEYKKKQSEQRGETTGDMDKQIEHKDEKIILLSDRTKKEKNRSGKTYVNEMFAGHAVGSADVCKSNNRGIKRFKKLSKTQTNKTRKY